MAYLHCELKAETIRMTTSIGVILPQDIHRGNRPVKTLYLLHGRSHNYSVWSRYTGLERYAENYNAAIIMPEVNRSFYTDMTYGLDYQAYLSRELPDLCESMFHISPIPQDRYIAGMSMGGYGALKSALRSPERYAACGAISAVTDIRHRVAETPDSDPRKQEFRAIFGDDCAPAPEDDIFHLAVSHATSKHRPNFYLACGTEDHLYPDSLRLSRHLQTLSYQVCCEEWQGIHDWGFWDEALKRLLAHFFADKVQLY